MPETVLRSDREMGDCSLLRGDEHHGSKADHNRKSILLENKISESEKV